MPRFVSVAGKWHPALEVTQLPLSPEDLAKGKNPVYRGPDRAALAMMVEQGYAVEDQEGPIYYSGEDENYKGKRFKISDYPGRDCFTDPDVIRLSRENRFNSVDEYLFVMFNIKREDIEAKSKQLLENLVIHDAPVRRGKATNAYAGAKDVAGPGPFKEGGFGEKPI